jgi:alpha-D-xyloside xylohydrolase
MRKMNYWIVIFLFILTMGCKNSKYEKLDNGIIVPVDKKKIRLQVVSKDIIRVTVSPGESFSTEKSLMVLDSLKTFSDWKVEEKEGIVLLSTSSVIAEISLKTGEVSFKDSTGAFLLKEKVGGGATFTPVTAGGKSFYSIQQVFESPNDEAFYGLGQHQFGYMNYKGKDVELAQHNIDIAVPFVYSNKNYGVLWDNYSITRFGDPRAYEQISSMKLYGADGKEGGLTANYYVQDKVKYSKTENLIDYSFLETPQYDTFPKDVNYKGKVVWEGSISSDVEGKHKFLIYASNYFKVWVDGKLIMDKWRQNWNPWYNPFEIVIKKNEKHSIKIEWIPNGGFMGLTHLNPQSEEDQNRLSLFSEVANEIDYYFIRGNKADDVIGGYRAITGKAPIVPKWAMGFWQSRERYTKQDELIDVVKTFRAKKVPLDNIVLDWFYWPEDKWGSHDFDTSRFYDAKAMVDQLHNELHTNIMISVWPKFYPGTNNFKEMQDKGYLYQHNLEMKRKDWVGPGYANTFYDAMNEDAGKLFWKQIDKKLNSKGFDAWWLDASEPDQHSNLTIAERKLNMTPTALGPGEKYFNAFPLMNAKGVYEGQRISNPGKRVFILTRSGYAGQQRYGAATWSGDIVSRWSDLKDQISAGVNYSLSGLPYWTMDIGGFALEDRYVKPNAKDLDEWRELNTRWYQFGSFCPIFRVHGQYPFREVFNLAPENTPTYSSLLYYNKLRYSLMPYYYTLAGKAYHENYTIMRGLVMDFGQDKNVLSINDQFMVGPSLLVNPVSEYKAKERQVYLPSTTNWYDLYTGEFLAGGKTISAKAPLTTIPVYVKEGSILPAGQDMQYTNEKPDSIIYLYVYAGKDASFDLYSDEGINYNYEDGSYTIVPITYFESTGKLKIGARKGGYSGMLKKQNFKIILIQKGKPVSFGNSKGDIKTIEYTGEAVELKIN